MGTQGRDPWSRSGGAAGSAAVDDERGSASKARGHHARSARARADEFLDAVPPPSGAHRGDVSGSNVVVRCPLCSQLWEVRFAPYADDGLFALWVP